MQYAINKKDAIWLASSAGNPKVTPMLALVNVATNQFGHCAATTNGHSLHVVEVAATIPAGLYTLDKKTGTLTATAPPDGQRCYPDWPAIVPTKFTLEGAGPFTERASSEDGCLIYILPNAGIFAKNLFDKAIPAGSVGRIKMNKPTQPIKITITTPKQNRQQFAVVMPRRA